MMCLSQEGLELIRFWRISDNKCNHGNTFKIIRSKFLWVFHSLNLYTDFEEIFRICLAQEGLDLIRLWGYPAATIAMATLFKIFGS